MAERSHPRDVARTAIRTRHLTHHFQPIVHLGSAALLGFEALARFPEQTPPDRVWAAVRGTEDGLALGGVSVGRAVETGHSLPGRLFLNVSAHHLGHIGGPECPLLGAMQQHHLQPTDIILEVTEDDVCDVDGAVHDIARLRQAGIAFALDDAGAEHSDRQRLHWLQPEYVKLDRALVGRWRSGEQMSAQGWIERAHQIGAMVIAEGVEEADALDPLLRAGVDAVQGYATGRPQPVGVWEQALSADQVPWRQGHYRPIRP